MLPIVRSAVLSLIPPPQKYSMPGSYRKRRPDSSLTSPELRRSGGGGELMGRIVRWCLKNKSVVILATILLIGSGVYATTRLNQELLPDISFPIITISTPVAGAGPDLVDEQVTQPVEDAIN